MPPETWLPRPGPSCCWGPITVVAHPDGRVRLDQRRRPPATAAPATLAGIVGGLLCQGVDALDAAAAGAWLHGRAACEGPVRGLVASDVVDGLPAVLAEMGEVRR